MANTRDVTLCRLGPGNAMRHSMGSYVTLAAWKLAAERFLALGLIDSQAGADAEQARQARYRLTDRLIAGN
jgi:hypothetical protein